MYICGLFIFGRMVQKKLQVVIQPESALRLADHEHVVCSMTSLQWQWSASAPVCPPGHDREVFQVKGGSIA